MVAARLDSQLSLQRVSVWIGLVCLPVALLSGCKKADEIRTYTVAHRETPQLALQRMLGAIIPNDKEAWFFKLQGPDEEIGKLLPDFLTFTKSVAIEAGKVTWKAPENWKERPGGEFRFTTFLIPHGSDKPYELAISRLDAADGVNDAYLQANLSRWRGQVGLDPITADDVSKVTTKVEFKGGAAYVVNFVGLPSAGNSMGAPFANAPFAGGNAPAPVEQKPAPAAAGAEDFEFTTPKGWGPGKASSMRKASLAVKDGDMSADISVFAFPADANDLLSNVNRWRGQVGLDPVTAEALQKSTKSIDVGGETGEYVELVGTKETILGVMVKKGPSAWFFKLQAPTAMAGREKGRFEEFVKSSRLP